MSVPLVIVVVEQPTASTDPAALEGMLEAAAEGLPPDARVQLGAAAADTSGADVVVVLRWADAARRRATLHVTTRDGRATGREVVFGPDDTQRDRGRALGYATVAIIPEDLRTFEPAPPAPAEASGGAAGRVRVDQTPSTPPTDRDAGLERLWIEATAQGATGFVGGASSVGGGIAARLPFRPIALRAGAAARAGEVQEADASSLLLRADIGLGFWTIVLDPRLSVGARTGVVLFGHTLRRTDADGSRVSGTHTLIGVEAIAEASFALGARFALVAGAGTEIAFGKTRVLTGPSQVAVIPPIRVVSEVGARVRF